MDVVRSAVIWAGELALRATCHHHDGAASATCAYGEAWGRWSWMELGGFSLIVVGLVLFTCRSGGGGRGGGRVVEERRTGVGAD
jgi:hypothetical protein